MHSSQSPTFQESGLGILFAATLLLNALLLAGYAYSHFITQRLGVRTQTILHLSLLALAAIALIGFTNWAD